MSSIIEKALDKLADDVVGSPPPPPPFDPSDTVAPLAARPAAPALGQWVPPAPAPAAPVAPQGLTHGSPYAPPAAAPAQPAPAAPDLDASTVTEVPRVVSPPTGTVSRNFHHIDFERLAEKGCVTPDNLHSSVAEQIRLVKRPLLQSRPADVSDPGWHQNLIATTSSLPGEGKTFTSINLAISLAMELDRTVLLVDGDVAKSDISRVLEMDNEKGLSDLLTEPGLDVSDVMVRTNLEGLNIIPAGTRKPNLTELFASEQMTALCDEFATRYSDRIVLFDCAPLLAATGAQVLCELMGQVVFVVEAVSTSRAAIRESMRLLTNARSVGVVLNKSRHNRTPGYKYGNYYYYYGGQ